MGLMRPESVSGNNVDGRPRVASRELTFHEMAVGVQSDMDKMFIERL